MNLHQSHKLLQPSPNSNVQHLKAHPPTQTQQLPRKITHNAEYYTRKVIFGNSASDSEDDEEEEDGNEEEEKLCPIRSIPGYTRGELQLLLKQSTQLSEEDEKSYY